jgi:HK97 family phage portal protein
MLNRIRNAWWAFRQSPNISMAELDRLIEIGDLGERSSAGVRVSERAGTRLDTCYACINILSRDMSALPLRLLEKMANGGRAEVESHPVSEWAKNPNPVQTPMEFRQLGWASVLANGNQYAQVFRSDEGLIETWPVSPHRITKVFLGPDRRKRFEYRKNDGTAGTFTADELFHSYGLSFGGWTGVSPIRWCMETFGRAIALGDFAAAAFQSPRPSAIFEHPTGFSNTEQAKQFKEQWLKDFAGKRGRKNIAVLPAGLVLKTFGEIPNDDAQFIETAKFSKEQITQIFLVPMHRVNALDKATFSNIEHQDLEYVKYSLVPWLTLYEQSLEKMLLTPQERQRFQIRHNVEGLLRGDFKSRMEGYAVGIDRSVYTINEARAKEDRPPVEGGDEPIIPLNMGPLSQLGEQPEPEPEFDPDDEDDE